MALTASSVKARPENWVPPRMRMFMVEGIGRLETCCGFGARRVSYMMGNLKPEWITAGGERSGEHCALTVSAGGARLFNSSNV